MAEKKVLMPRAATTMEDGRAHREEIEDVINALSEVDRILDENGGNTEIIRRIKVVAKELAGKDPGMGKYGGIRKNVAEAILRSYLKMSVDHL
ncbi:hypothetical protein ACFX5Q_25750 [Mesorhizobium sp. IMUNJ 23033]|uniref:hypothetical protein n=1 Tax=Mesorhizobium sp. IMUNJ 23033 TaxID=3378039 RepID=UPI00384D7F2B